MSQKLAAGALGALVAAGALLPGPVLAADLVLGQKVFDGTATRDCSWLWAE